MCGEHMWEENYLFMHDLFSFIPSLDDPTKTIKQDTREFTRLLGHLRHGIAGHAPAQDASRPALYRGFEGYVRLGMGMIATLDQLGDVRMVGSVLRLR